MAFAEVFLSNRRDAALSEAAARVPGIEQAQMIAGSFNYLLEMRIRHITGYRRFPGGDNFRLSAGGRYIDLSGIESCERGNAVGHDLTIG